jgi:hypothetical protein
MRLIHNGFIAIALTAVPVAASAQMTPPATQPSVPNEPAMPPPPSTPAQNPADPDQAQPPAGQDQAPAAATAADVKAGAAVYDPDGGTVGKIGAVSGDEAVIDTGSVRAKVPISSLAKGDKGLVIGMTKAELEAAAKEKSPPK